MPNAVRPLCIYTAAPAGDERRRTERHRSDREGGLIAARARPKLPLVLRLHGSDVFGAERNALAGRAARSTFAKARWTTACSDDLHQRAIALGARPDRIETVPYGVDATRFEALRAAGVV